MNSLYFSQQQVKTAKRAAIWLQLNRKGVQMLITYLQADHPPIFRSTYYQKLSFLGLLTHIPKNDLVSNWIYDTGSLENYLCLRVLRSQNLHGSCFVYKSLFTQIASRTLERSFPSLMHKPKLPVFMYVQGSKTGV